MVSVDNTWSMQSGALRHIRISVFEIQVIFHDQIATKSATRGRERGERLPPPGLDKQAPNTKKTATKKNLQQTAEKSAWKRVYFFEKQPKSRKILTTIQHRFVNYSMQEIELIIPFQ